jgi:hypothetical protein
MNLTMSRDPGFDLACHGFTARGSETLVPRDSWVTDFDDLLRLDYCRDRI